ncbi:non-ribosomal peptide synthetase [Saccharomonospora azurea]|uniref:non-ribosomal peptide synthetase n=1 Tax=Saccharomonospora azurea TaxID=40988 RepID=UPI003D8F5CDC
MSSLTNPHDVPGPAPTLRPRHRSGTDGRRHVSEVPDREYWRAAYHGGTRTTVPRWTLEPVTGAAVHEEAVPDDLVGTLDELSDELDVPLCSVLLAAHARVLAALSGERDVVTGYVAGRAPLPCRLTTTATSWRELLADVRHAEADLLAHDDVSADEVRRGLTESPFEAVFDPDGAGNTLAEDTDDTDVVLEVSFPRRAGRLVLRVRYRTDILDADAAARIAGYHVTALRLMASDPEARHGRQSLLSADEWHRQIEGLGGPRRRLPDRRVHELFEERVRTHPDLAAAVWGERSWTYRELNDRANAVGRALLAEGLRPEEPVAVVMERDLDWLASVLGIFKAGGAYLPIEPHFPADRIATTLTRAGSTLVLTDEGSTRTLDQALITLPAVRVVFADAVTRSVDSAAEATVPGEDSGLGVAVAPDQLAYIYFTSGSTGEPKGAMCEHAGLVNHLHAKIDDLGICAGDVVAQTAPQCFDISLWQLVSALLVGGRTLLIDQDTILDGQRFVDTLVRGHVAVLQVVPSYLDVVLSCLERDPRTLDDLRCVSVTGEPVKPELVRRWFAAQPGVALVNAYGLTETSDDTNHEVMYRAPDADRVPIGRLVNNVNAYVVDDRLSPVPLGAPGEIVFSGVCVGRGYINDPDRTRQAFLADPHRPGARLYRSGDHGRWRPDGKLEFLGRRDSQVKIRGFRVEIGEVENALLRVPGIRDGAVVVDDAPGRSARLVAFYSGDREIEEATVRERLARSLPEYMVPSTVEWQRRLPLTANGKIDKKALMARAADLDGPEPDVEHDAALPGTATERRLAAAWATALGLAPGQITTRDHFFERGGTSLSAVRVAIALDRAVSLADITRHPVLGDLARLVDARASRQPEPSH